MKKSLLSFSAVLLIGTVGFGQFTQNTVPELNEQQEMWLLDSNAVDYASVVGDGVTWDYSDLKGYRQMDDPSQFESRVLLMEDATQTSYASDFPTSTHAFTIQNLLTSYSTVSASGMQGNGYAIQDVGGMGGVNVTFDAPGATYYEYPFNYGDNASSSYTGSAEVPMFGPQVISGGSEVEIDGRGTLKLANNTYTNVLRYKLAESGVANNVPILGDIELARVQYEYYDFSVSKFPIFIYSNVIVGEQGGAPLMDVFSVLSLDKPTEAVSVGLNVEELTNAKVYPNPSSDVININLSNKNNNSVDVEIVNNLGQVVYSTSMNASTQSIDVSSLNTGIYFVRLTSEGNTATQKIMIK